ncbi:dihydrolipoamide acetyltransferase family protein [Ideonella sp. YS5]|uniref:dihydrolipoamide acetyltransferase family protein n=1 Tax=Ideonella sp. YS5 TaxID=3453714 RepID=UPI003EE871A1
MIELNLPSFGADMDEAVFVQWNVQPGQPVKKGDIACVVETQKGAIDVEVWQDGTVARLAAEPGQRLPVGQLLAVLAEPAEDWQTVAASSAPAAAPPSPVPPAPEPPRISPAARRRAEQLGVNLQALAGRVGNRPVTIADVEEAAASAAATTVAEGMRAAIAAAMARSKREIPHYYLGCEIEVEAALAWLEGFNAGRPLPERVLWAALALRAIGLALRESPELNGRFVNGRFEPSPAVHLGVVTSLREGGLVVPTVHDADRQDLGAVMRQLREALGRARQGQLRSSDLADSTATVTNLGDLGTDTVYGVIYPPQVALVGLGRIAQRPVVRDGQLAVARTVQVTLAADHRVSDGLVGARFLAALRARLAQPEGLV